MESTEKNINFSLRELKLMKLLSNGIDFSELPNLLSINSKTVETYLKVLMVKTEVKSVEKFVAWINDNEFINDGRKK